MTNPSEVTSKSSHVQPTTKPSALSFSKPPLLPISREHTGKSLLSSSRLLTSKPATSGGKVYSSPITQTPSKAPIKTTPTIPTAVKPITKRTEGAPQYDFSTERPKVQEEPKFLPPEIDASVQSPPAPVVDMVRLKTSLINAVATSLLCSPDFHDAHDTTRRSLCKLGEKLSRHDPEFVLKLALYTRSNLNIRTTANFLLALASNIQNCRPYLKKYYSSSIRLPSDWIEVAEIYQAFHDKSINFGALPTALRRVMGIKFSEFDAYQLAKYNKDSSKKKKQQKGKEGDIKKKPPQKSTTKLELQEESGSSSGDDSDSDSESDSVVVSEAENEEELERLSFTLKQLIRKIHISEPVEHVMCLVGKKYPEDPESFRRSRLPGTWDQDRAGKRMKLPVPETWETQVSTKGNKPSTWEELIDHQKLPFMAMLRNLRNLIIAGVSPKHHQWVIRKLNDERAVVNSRQFPFRFFSAYKVLEDLEKGEAPTPAFKQKGKFKKKKPKELPKIDPKLLQRYRSALDNALKIATCYNVKPISGSTLILCNVGSNMSRPCTAARGLGKPRTVQEVGILLGLMCKYSCEQCLFLIYGENSYTEVQLQEGTILHNMGQVMTAASSQGLTSKEGCVPTHFLQSMLVDRVAIDNLVLLTDAMKLDDQQGREMMDFLKKYRHLVNPNLLFVSVDLSGTSSGINSTIKPEHENDIYLAGYSDQILRFIAERGDSGQLTYVDNIDKAYNLKPLKLPALVGDPSPQPATLGPEKALMAATQQQRWRTVRVFISSTFRDMHGERDLLTRFVFPELRARAHARQIQVYEVDLRWGVTEEAARSHKALEICLGEISRCQYFLGLLGQRYGWVQEEYHIPDGPEFDWLREFPAGRSITEIEMQHASLCDPEKAVGKAFFYFRHPSCLTTIPEKFRQNFASESEEAEVNIEHLKSYIRTSGLEVYDGYPAKWLGVIEEKQMLGGLEDFGQRVLHNLWNAIQKDFPEEEIGQDPISVATSLHEAFIENRASSFVGRKALLKQAKSLVEDRDEKIVLVAGKPGSGKSAFMAAFAQHYMECHGSTGPSCVLSHFIGAAPDSTNIASILTRLCHEMKRRFGVDLDVPEDYADLVKDWPDFLKESVLNMAGKDTKLVVLIDGIDLLEDKHNGRAMDWVPAEIPDGVVIVLSGVESGSCVGILRKHKPAPSEVTVSAMDVLDKAEMVRRTLAKHRKTLDESPFNNQMKLLLTKKEANNPLYLHLACEELRVFGVFEEVTVFLKKMPTTISTLLQEIITRMELEHGTEVLATSLSLLSLVRNGLQEHELSGVLSLFIAEKYSEVEGMLPPMVISRLLRSLQTFLQPSGKESANLLTLAHKDVEKAVRFRYMRGAVSEQEKNFHKLLASYFKSEADPSGDGLYKGNNARAYSELPFHLVAAGAWKELEETLCNIRFVVAKCQMGLANQLLEDFTPTLTGLPPAKAREVAKFIQQPKVQAFKSFISRNLHVLSSHPALALQQAVNEPSTSIVTKAAQDILQDNPQPVITWVNKLETPDPCHMTVSSHSGSVTCVAVSQDSSLFAVGFMNCVLKLYEVSTGKEIHSFIGHAGGITGVCFVGSHGLCSASHDCSLSLWDIKEGFRIATMKGHNRSVCDCAANLSGKLIVSVSWDASVKVWDGKKGEMIATLKTADMNNTPVNCVAFHPEGQLVVVGSWDAKLKIWDTFNKKKLKTLKGHKTSIQACAYAPSGRHIVSAALDGEVKIWSTRSGSAVGSLVGHHFPVNSIAFTPNGQYLATASSDQVLKVWSGTLGQPVFSMGSAEHGFAHCLTFDPLTQSVRVGYHNGHVRKFNIQTGVEAFAVKVHEAAVVGVAYRENFHMSASEDTTIKIWNPAALPKCINLVGHKTPITCAVWDKNGFASASDDQTILIWPHQTRDYTKLVQTVSKGQQVDVKPVAIFHGHTAKISSIAFAPGGLKMVTASHDQSLIIWDTLGYKQLQILHACHKDWINTCTFSDTTPDILVTGSNDFTLKVWDLKTGAEKTKFKGHTSSINSVAFSQGCIVSAAFDGSVKVWTHKGVEITTLYCHKQRVNACLVNIPNKLNASGSEWADIVASEEDTEETRQKMKLEEISVITASDDGTVGVWKPFVPNEITALVGHSDRVLSVATTFNNHFISSSLDGSIRLWSPDLAVEPGKVSLTSTTLKGHTGPVTSCMMSEDGTYAISGGRDGYFILWLIKRGKDEEGGETKLEHLYRVRASEKPVSSVCFLSVNQHSKGASFAIGRDDGAVSIYRFSPADYPTEDSTIAAGTLMGAHPISKLAVTPDSKTVIAGSWSNRIAAISSNKRISSRLDAHKGWVMDLTAVEENGSSVVYSVGLDKTLYRWPLPAKQGPSRQPATISNASKFSLLLDDGEREEAWLLAMCNVGHSYLAIADSKGRISLWNKETKKIELTRKIHQKAINALAMVSGNLVTGSDDCSIKVWKLTTKQTAKPSTSLKQVGHFHCQSCVTSITSVCSTEKNQLPLFVVGDSLGHVILLQWHQ